MRRALFLISLALLTASASTAWATTYRVGPGRAYAKLQDVVSLLNPGDIVEVDGDATYPGDVTFRRGGTAADPITIRGIRKNGKLPLISGGANTLHFRTDDIGEGADHYVVEDLEITGGSSRCVFHQSDDLTLRGVVVRDCPAHGILGADWGAGSLTVEHSEVHGCGSGGSKHQIYIGMDEDNYPDGVFRLQYSWIHDGNGGNNVKSRAARNEIYYNRIEGAYYHEVELIGAECCNENVVREDSDVVGNLIIKRPPPHGPHPDFYATRLGGDGTGQTWGRYRFVNNTFVMGADAVFRLFDGMESLEVHNNVFYRYDGNRVDILRDAEVRWKNGPRIAGSSNWVTNGTLNIPSTWTGTLTGTNPGFANVSASDFSIAAGSPLVGAAQSSPSGPPGSPFPNPLFPPAFHPPGPPGVFGTSNPRPVDSALDIGAYEAAVTAPPPAPPAIYSFSATPSTIQSGQCTTLSWSVSGADYVALDGASVDPSGSTSDCPSVPTVCLLEATNVAGTSSAQVSLAVTEVAPGTPVSRYRLYLEATLEHHYTTDPNEYVVLGTRGWIQEGIAHRVYTTDATVHGQVPTPLYRLYHSGIQQHLWTTDVNEYTQLALVGWTQEGIDGYVLVSAVPGVTVPLYRMAHAALPLHLWTTDLNEYDVLVGHGWIQEGVVGHVVP